ncbi:hypothetical protein [Bradyrhizobium sp. LHD-71]|uniref:hypothetical protein n=1 Tax=Bradyrhizobium sp. LHD-71 TaxID=3072141 RepID=UPI00280E162C|nr:hypothetical protein [Bradyrhizobium sp. LHD-71]MDQ8727635.1 hypothetical protein [Bradyrhizobium sp. LHD-71]
MRLKVADVVEAVSQLVKRGYDREYRIKDGHLFDLARNSPLDPRDIHVDTALRLESGPDAGDASNVYAISDQKTHSKGLLIDAFDIFDEICDPGLAERLVDSRFTEFIEDGDVPSRYGLRKVYKNEYDRDPERYVLRIGYPDFPECPFGESFSMLGFDTAEQAYVWLVTSILRDSRLNRIPYQGSDVPDNE